MDEVARRGVRGRLYELLQVALALLGVYLLLSVADLAVYERLANREAPAPSTPLACVMVGPLSERVVAGDFSPGDVEPGVGAEANDQPSGELQGALGRVKARVGALAAGIREGDVSYAAVDGIADLVGAELRQESSNAPARLISPAGIVEIVPFSRTARRNLGPVELSAPPVVAQERLYVPVRGLDALLPVQARYDETLRAWKLASGDREMSVAMPEDLFEIEISRSERALTVRYAGEQLVRWACCTGAGNNTPVGTFHIQNKAQWPPWTAYWGEYMPGGSPRNPLGARWLGTTAHGRETGRVIGIHGTNQPSSIGRRISGGCIRLTNAHAIEMYNTIPIGTRVIIHE